MAIPLLEYAPVTQNSRITGYEIPGEEQPRIYSTEYLPSAEAINDLIWAGYRQIFSEHQILENYRQTFLESQLRSGQISVRDFIRGLATSDIFRRLNFDTNNNYEFVRKMVQRILGRNIYGKREELAWSIVIATKGLNAFIDQLLDSDEYLEHFGDEIIPYQRRRVIPQRSGGEMPFNLQTPRYGDYHRSQLGFPQVVWQSTVRSYVTTDRAPKTGDPANFLNMARSINPKGTPSPRVSAMNINMELVPYRKR